ncbi:zinc-binding dehydrogenase [Glonium stellatum]|uniref:Zinc-binding dehydrogenase n=1 Tax=Glonium stellatum TaxID=574774 RepID=A0A8E2EVV8_9PEZI|nr:zinc-binding dehydrogenase [Glonium stellatum]
MPNNIRKAVISSFGDESKVSVVDSIIEDPPANHVQVRVLYSGFSGADINMRLGVYPLQRKAPLTPGYTFIGRVRANGAGSTKYSPGDLVTCLTICDAEAELANVPEKYLIQPPAGVDLQQACALILDWNTAYGLVMHSAKVSAGQKVFIHGISGAVGYATMILSQLQGAEVYGTASAAKHAHVKQLGATPFDYSNKDWMASMKDLGGTDAVFDALGFESWDESFSILSKHGILVGYGGNLNRLKGEPTRSGVGPTAKLLARNLNVFCGKRTKFYYITRDDRTFNQDVMTLFDLSLQGKIRVPIKRIYNLEDIQEAHKSWNSTGGVGSILIKVADEDST